MHLQESEQHRQMYNKYWHIINKCNTKDDTKFVLNIINTTQQHNKRFNNFFKTALPPRTNTFGLSFALSFSAILRSQPKNNEQFTQVVLLIN